MPPHAEGLLGEAGGLRFFAKPPGVPVFPPHADPSGESVLTRLLTALPDQRGDWPPGFEGGIAHRLDTLTSGFVVVARTPAVLAELRAGWTTFRKFYRFKSEANPGFSRRDVTAPIAHHARRADRVVVQRWPRERHRGAWMPATTRLRALGEGWWEAEIRTGFRHQVRAHAAFAGVPLTGDELYGGPPGVVTLIHVAVVAAEWRFELAELPGP